MTDPIPTYKSPSEYKPDGTRQWNAYPFVSQHAGDITLGHGDSQYTINAAEARYVAAALFAAAYHAEKDNRKQEDRR